MESSPRQIRVQTRSVSLTNQRGSADLNHSLAFLGPRLESSLPIDVSRVTRSLPCPEVIEERNRMAREIHDTLAQQFAGILLHLEAAGGLDNVAGRNVSDCIARAKELAKLGLEDSRRMLLGLRPKSLEGAGLRDALKQLAHSFSRECGIRCSFCWRGRSHELSEDAENELYRVAQEALCNVRKHSRAHSVSVTLRYSSGGVLLAVKDNGQGFVVKKPQGGAHGFGLPTISDRALRLGGKVDVDSRPGAGTELKVTVPLQGTATERNYQ